MQIFPGVYLPGFFCTVFYRRLTEGYFLILVPFN